MIHSAISRFTTQLAHADAAAALARVGWRAAPGGRSESDDPSAFGQSLLLAGIEAPIERHLEHGGHE